MRMRPNSSEDRRVSLARWSTIAWGVLLFGLALLARSGGRVVETGLSIASVAYGAMLGVFLLGVLTRKASEHGAIVGMLLGFVFNLYLWLFTKVSFTWYVVLGSVVTFCFGYFMSLIFPGRIDRK